MTQTVFPFAAQGEERVSYLTHKNNQERDALEGRTGAGVVVEY